MAALSEGLDRKLQERFPKLRRFLWIFESTEVCSEVVANEAGPRHFLRHLEAVKSRCNQIQETGDDQRGLLNFVQRVVARMRIEARSQLEVIDGVPVSVPA